MSEAKLNDFAAQLRQQVQVAREAQQHQQEELQRQATQEAERDQRRRERVEELSHVIPRRFDEAVRIAGGALQFSGPSRDTVGGGIDVTAYDLYWNDKALPPLRGLRIVINPLKGAIHWVWILNTHEVGRMALDPLGFDLAILDQLILALADQQRWKQGRVPTIV